MSFFRISLLGMTRKANGGASCSSLILSRIHAVEIGALPPNESGRRSNIPGSAPGPGAPFGGPPKRSERRASTQKPPSHTARHLFLRGAHGSSRAGCGVLAATNFFPNPRLLSGDFISQHDAKKFTISSLPQRTNPGKNVTLQTDSIMPPAMRSPSSTPQGVSFFNL